ncbi:MAG: alkaline phosphatase [Alphaproteobacteria bacterium]|nr:alkaline phosphatase [Alphaproteobacteria bacterium]
MRLLLAAAAVFWAVTVADAQTIYPIDRAEILAGTRFDFKVEFPQLAAAEKVKVTVNGVDHAAAFGKAAAFIEREDDEDESALLLRDVVLTEPGLYNVRATDGVNTREVTWNVYETGPRQAKNVILFIGDGMSPAHRTAARLLSKGIAEGKAFGKLAIDDMPHMALVATAGSDSIITDSANSMSAYTTGHKSATNAMGVYADRTDSPFDDPRVENITSLVKRRLGMAVGVVTNTEIEDATPAAMVAHTRRRGTYDQIVDQLYAARPEVIMGGGSAHFLPNSNPGAHRKDNIDYMARFRNAGYNIAATATELNAAASTGGKSKLLGLFNSGNMDGALDRKFLKGGTVTQFPDQPDLTDQVRVALNLLSRKPEGFVLMVESGLIDKYTHALDMERAVYDTIMLDNAVKLARDWAAARSNDTLILVVADHNHPISLIGTIDDDMTETPKAPLRERVGVYDKAGFPNYPAANKEGYPARVDVSRRLAIFSASSPDYYETFRPKLDNPNDPTVAGSTPGTYAPNEHYRAMPGAMLRLGNLPKYLNASVHSGEDVILTATGPGSERVRGQIDNTEVFRIIAEALGLGHRPPD